MADRFNLVQRRRTRPQCCCRGAAAGVAGSARAERQSRATPPCQHGRQPARRRLLPGPADRDHVHQAAATLEALVRSRRSPYLCKVERARATSPSRPK